MAEQEHQIEHPNRKKASSKLAKWGTVVVLLLSAALILVVSIGGWNTLQGAKPLQVAYIVLFVVLAFLVARWRSGVLPLAAAMATLMIIFAAVAAPQWFERGKPGFEAPTIPAEILGTLTFAVIPLQLLLIAVSMFAFRQKWNVEVGVEEDDDEYDDDEEYGRSSNAAPAPA